MDDRRIRAVQVVHDHADLFNDADSFFLRKEIAIVQNGTQRLAADIFFNDNQAVIFLDHFDDFRDSGDRVVFECPVNLRIVDCKYFFHIDDAACGILYKGDAMFCIQYSNLLIAGEYICFRCVHPYSSVE